MLKGLENDVELRTANKFISSVNSEQNCKTNETEMRLLCLLKYGKREIFRMRFSYVFYPFTLNELNVSFCFA